MRSSDAHELVESVVMDRISCSAVRLVDAVLMRKTMLSEIPSSLTVGIFGNGPAVALDLCK